MFKNLPSEFNNLKYKSLFTYIIQVTIDFMLFKVCKISVGEEWLDSKFVPTLKTTTKKEISISNYLVISSSSLLRNSGGGVTSESFP